MNDLTTCETCHLSKVQRYVSRESRLMPSEPLDEIFVDTVEKVIKAMNDHQYTVMLTDVKTRMRWAITTHTKDQIAQSLVDWIKLQLNQFDKRVRIIFRDGGSEFTRTRNYCVRHGIRADTSAPDTPEQNGASEAANKVILRAA